MPLKILICGGGLAGLSVAGFLRQGGGHDITVLERGSKPSRPPPVPHKQQQQQQQRRQQQHQQQQPEDYGLSIVANAFGLLQKAGAVRIPVAPTVGAGEDESGRAEEEGDGQDDLDMDMDMDMAIMTHLWMRDHANGETATVHFDTRRENGNGTGNGSPSVLVRRERLRWALLRFATSASTSISTTSSSSSASASGRRGPPAKIIYDAKVARVDVEKGVVETVDGRVFDGRGDNLEDEDEEGKDGAEESFGNGGRECKRKNGKMMERRSRRRSKRKGYDLVIGADGINSAVRDAVLDSLYRSVRGEEQQQQQRQQRPEVVQTHDLLAFMTALPVSALPVPEFEFLTRSVVDASSSSSSSSSSSPDKEVSSCPRDERQAGLVSWSDATGSQGPQKRRILAYHSSPRDLQVIGYAPLLSSLPAGKPESSHSAGTGSSSGGFADEFGGCVSALSGSSSSSPCCCSPTTTTTIMTRTAILRNVDVRTRVLPLFEGAFAPHVSELLLGGGAECSAWRLRDVTSRRRLVDPLSSCSSPSTSPSTYSTAAGNGGGAGVESTQPPQQLPPNSDDDDNKDDKNSNQNNNRTTINAKDNRKTKPKDWWRAHRTLLIGDAAHAVVPHAGQGCNMAIEDAEALGYLLRDFHHHDNHDDDDDDDDADDTDEEEEEKKKSDRCFQERLEGVLDRYIALRRPRARLVARRSRELAGLPVEREDEDDDDDDGGGGGEEKGEELAGGGGGSGSVKCRQRKGDIVGGGGGGGGGGGREAAAAGGGGGGPQLISNQEFARAIHGYRGLEEYIKGLEEKGTRI